MGGKLAGRRVVVTGASRGIGFEIAKRFLEEGAEVLGVARNRRTLGRANLALVSFGRAWTSLLADVGLPGTSKRIAAAVRKRWGALDLLVNNAGVSPGSAPFEKETDAAVEETLRINVLGPHRLILALLPLLRKGRNPRIVNVSSGAGSEHSIATGGTMSAYRLSKWSLNGLTRLWAAELKGKISVVAMDPGWVRTDMGGPEAPDPPTLSAQRALEVALLPPSVTGTYQIGAKTGGW
jgi:NAD(P)-dependent dehydrogenase (short-subunit alcohol dehydrogenase family)